jgi:hypothetical protein
LELIKEIAPELGRIALIFNPEAAPFADNFVGSMERVARLTAINLMVSPTGDAAEIDAHSSQFQASRKGAPVQRICQFSS